MAQMASWQCRNAVVGGITSSTIQLESAGSLSSVAPMPYDNLNVDMINGSGSSIIAFNVPCPDKVVTIVTVGSNDDDDDSAFGCTIAFMTV